MSLSLRAVSGASAELRRIVSAPRSVEVVFRFFRRENAITHYPFAGYARNIFRKQLKMFKSVSGFLNSLREDFT
jgi:hypothetical protein